MKYQCGTPKESCSGSNQSKEAHQSGHKLHNSVTEARKCYLKYILSLGYIRDKLCPQMFRDPNNGPTICIKG